MSKEGLAIAMCALALAGKGEGMDIERVLQEYADANGTVGASVGYIEGGKIEYFSVGKAAAGGAPVNEETIFEIGSITKVFTTLCLMDMATKGEVGMDDPIELYLPEAKVPEKEGKKITLRHLATHYSGLPRLPTNFQPKNPENPYADYSLEDLFAFLSGYTLPRVPGEEFEYSNLGMGLLGFLLSTKAMQTYEQLVFDSVTQKLGMEDTSISVPPGKEFAKGYQGDKEVSYWDFQECSVGCGGLRSNVKDMTRFLASNMGLVDSPLAELMRGCHQPQNQNQVFSVGLGWILSQSNEAEIVWHNGGTGGFRSFLGFNPKSQKGVVILSNSAEDWPDELGFLLLDPDYQRPAVNQALSVDSEYMNRFAGSYVATISPDLPKQDVQIAVYGRQLGIVFSGGEIGMLYPESHGVFGVKGFPDGKVHFSLDEMGQVVKVEARLVSTGALLWEAVLPK